MDPNGIAAQTEEEDQLSAAIDELRDVLHEGADSEPGLGLSDPGFGMAGPGLGMSEPGLDMGEPGLGMPQSDFGSPGAGSGLGGLGAAAARHENHGVIMDIPVDVQIVLGSTEMPVSELMALQKGSTVALDRKIGEPVDVVVNGRKIAAGEVTVLDSDPSRFGIKLTHIVDSSRKG